jgi:beta-glucosidase
MGAMDDLELVLPLSGADWWNVPASSEVPAIKVTDGPAGARGERFAGGPPSVSFPCGAAMGATWDVELIERVGAALAEETRAKGAQVLLGPTINLQRSPLGGRHFECFSEDPVLTAELARAYVAGLQGGGVAACVKHLVANDIEADRFEISSEPDERTYREVYLRPFEVALKEAGAWSTMAAYNRLHGTHCSEHPELLTTVLRDEWGWDGVVISDWFATRSTAASALAGLDLEMPGPAAHWGAALADAVGAGEVDRSVIQAKRDRLRLLAERTGSVPAPDGPGGSAAAVAVAREAAAAAIVLLKNDGGVLPLAPGTRIAVVGPHADREVFQGGGSAAVTPTDVATIADGLRERFGDAVVAVLEGDRASRGTAAIDGKHLRRADGTVGVDVEVVGPHGGVRQELRPRQFRALFLDNPGEGVAGTVVRATASYTPTASGPHRFKVKANAPTRFFVDDERSDGPPHDGTVELVAGMPVALRVEATVDDPTMRLAAELRCDPPIAADAFEQAVAAAAAAEVAIVVIGLDGDWETEGRDRDDLSLPGRQVELVRAVAAAQPNTVVAVLAGAPVDVSWADEVAAVLWCWYPGQEAGRAFADVVSGDVDPGGRLPCTLPKRLEDTGAFLDTPPEPGVLRYQEGVYVGHRWYDLRGVEPAFPFGHGLSYATVELGPPGVDGLGIAIEVTNTGARAGVEVVQVYAGERHPAVRRPLRSLVAFRKVAIEPGATATAEIVLTPRDFARWDPAAHGWVAEVGEYDVWVGRSSRDLGEPVTITLTEAWRSAP